MKYEKRPMGKPSDRETPREYSLGQLLGKSYRGAFDLTAEDYRWVNGPLVNGKTKN